MYSGKTFFLLKPDALKRKVVAPIIKRILEGGFSISSEFRIRFDPQTIHRLYWRTTLSRFPQQYRTMKTKFLIDYMTSGMSQLLAVSLSSLPNTYASIYDYSREIEGTDYYPERCLPGSIRYDFRDPNNDGHRVVLESIPGFGDVSGDIVENLIHTPADYDEYVHQSNILKSLMSNETHRIEGSK